MELDTERRRGKRDRLGREISAYYEIGGVRRPCKIRNLSATGVFMEVTIRGLIKDELVDLVLTEPSGTLTKVHHLVGAVVRTTDEGIAMRLLGRTTQTRRQAGTE